MRAWIVRYILISGCYFRRELTRIHTPGEESLPQNRRQRVFPNGTLVIDHIQREADSGRYTCTAENRAGRRASRDVQINVFGEIYLGYIILFINHSSSTPFFRLRVPGSAVIVILWRNVCPHCSSSMREIISGLFAYSTVRIRRLSLLYGL